MHCMKVVMIIQLLKRSRLIFLSTRFLSSSEKTLTGCLPYTVSKRPLNFCMQILPIFDFFSKSAVHPKYCLVPVDVFTSKTYTSTMKSRHLLAQK